MTTKTDVMLERLDSILEQLEALGVPTRTLVVPEARLDAHGNPSLVSPGELIESAWGNAVVGRVVTKYPNRDAIFAVSPTTGQLAVALDQNVVWIGTGTAWKPTTIGSRAHFQVSGGPAQGIPPSTLTGATWPAEVTDAFNAVNAGTFTVPDGWGGRWQFDWSVDFPDGGQSGQRFAFLGTSTGVRYGESNPPAMEGGTRITGSASVLLADAATALVVMYHTDPGLTLACNATANSHFQGYYAGPD